MLYKLDTQEGQISLDKNIAIQVIEEQISQFRGKVWIANYKGSVVNFMSRLGTMDFLDAVDITLDEKGLSVRIYLVIRFGTSIRMVTQKLIADIRRELERTLELPVKEITVAVTGTLSKHIVRRNIEIRG